jgi:digalactosyldiacylglycerol synthase
MSTSEVLCTTSAEALAMGKFVILPRHCMYSTCLNAVDVYLFLSKLNGPFLFQFVGSNTFFLQFPNCLSYETWDECLERLQFALKNEPTPLSASFRHVLSWDGATERLIQASTITVHEAEIRKLKGLDKADIKAAQFHVDAGTKSNWLRKKILT